MIAAGLTPPRLTEWWLKVGKSIAVAGFLVGASLIASNADAQSSTSRPMVRQQSAPPVHLVPGKPATPQSHFTSSPIGPAVENPFAGLEQDLALPQPPVEHISQTPARPETRPTPNQLNSSGHQLQSVLNGGQRLPSNSLPKGSVFENESSLQPSRLPAANNLRTPVHNSSTEIGTDGFWQDEDTSGDGNKQLPDRKKAEKDCGEFRQQLLSNPISTIALDISPPRNTRGSEPDQIFRDWTDIFGNSICSGRMVDLKRGYVVVDTGSGLQKISFSRLNETDLAAICEAWQLPSHCLASVSVFQGRCWTPQTMTWHAANLCHKPLYFEDRQLERYGHSDGPFLQPVRSTAHFFVSLVTLPYQTGIHPPNECQYALGYYRPGNCAPWLAYPIPISGNGLLHQAGFMIPGAFSVF